MYLQTGEYIFNSYGVLHLEFPDTSVILFN